MKNNIRIIRDKLFRKQRIVVTAMLAILFVGMSVGYAAYYTELQLGSTVGLAASKIGTLDDLDITNAEAMSGYSTGTAEYDKKKTDDGINFNLALTADLGYKVWLRFEVTVVNNSKLNYTYMGSDASISFKDYGGIERPIKYPVITGMIKGDVIAPGQTKKIYISFYADDEEYKDFGGSYKLSSNLILSFSEGKISEQRPSFLTALLDTETVLNEKKNGQFRFTLTSLFDCSQVVSFYVLDEDFELIVSSGETTDANRIVNKDASDELIAIVHLKRGLEQKDEYKTKLMGKLEYEATGEYEVFEIGDIIIKNDSSIEEPAETLDNFSVELDFDSSSWPGHASGSITLTNNNNFDIEQWVVRIYVNEEVEVSSITGSQHKLDIDVQQSRLMIYSDNAYGVNHYPISAKSTLVVDGINIEISGVKERPNDWTTIYYDLEIEKVMVDVYYEGAWHYGLVVE